MKEFSLNLLESIIENNFYNETYFYMAHILDQILIGEKNDTIYSVLINKIQEGQLLELHLFNNKREVIITRTKSQYFVYQPLIHDEKKEYESVITRKYCIAKELKNSIAGKYTSLEVKEYVAYDKESHMAYIDKKVLYSLE